MSTKQKRAVLSIKDEQIVISHLDKGEKGTNLAQEFGISKQQISDIRKNRDKILKFTDSIETSEGLKRKSPKLADDERLDKALYARFIQQRSTGTPISGPLPQEKAKHFTTQLNTETADREFKASTSWLEKFKTWHGIRNLSIYGEKLSAAEETAVKSHQRSQNIRSPKALLLIDNCSAHPDELSRRDGPVTCLLFPPNTTSRYLVISPTS